ncbi:MAG: hypothetical protein LW817_02460, partial [Candidatus Caenarcaniphilales bacterium]|nr:hypothetical protein [Candidatus Caenarcaniphilales bacterium]
MKTVDTAITFQQLEFDFDAPAISPSLNTSTQASSPKPDSKRMSGRALAKVLPRNQEQAELKEILANLCVLQTSRSSEIANNKAQDYQLITKIKESAIQPKLIAQEIYEATLSNLGISKNSSEVEEFLKKQSSVILAGKRIKAILKRLNDFSTLNGRPSKEKNYNHDFFK